MLDRLKNHARNPFAWLIGLLTVGLGLSLGASAAKGQQLRVVTTSGVLPETGCIPIMERSKDGALTGRMSCATEAQMREFCESTLKGYEKRKAQIP